MKTYLAKFRQGSGAMAMNAIDFYREGEEIYMYEWGMGGGTKKKVDIVPAHIDGYIRLNPCSTN